MQPFLCFPFYKWWCIYHAWFLSFSALKIMEHGKILRSKYLIIMQISTAKISVDISPSKLTIGPYGICEWQSHKWNSVLCPMLFARALFAESGNVLANSEGPDQTAHAQSDHGLHCSHTTYKPIVHARHVYRGKIIMHAWVISFSAKN